MEEKPSSLKTAVTCQRFEEQVISFSEQKFEKMFLESHMLEKKEEEQVKQM